MKWQATKWWHWEGREFMVNVLSSGTGLFEAVKLKPQIWSWNGWSLSHNFRGKIACSLFWSPRTQNSFELVELYSEDGIFYVTCLSDEDTSGHFFFVYYSWNAYIILMYLQCIQPYIHSYGKEMVCHWLQYNANYYWLPNIPIVLNKCLTKGKIYNSYRLTVHNTTFPFLLMEKNIIQRTMAWTVTSLSVYLHSLF